jgi:hypothetical protein
MNVAMRSQASVSPLSMSMASMGEPLLSIRRSRNAQADYPTWGLAIRIGYASWKGPTECRIAHAMVDAFDFTSC